MPASRPSSAAAIGRSLRQYHGDRDRLARMSALYRAFVPRGGLAFDIGAHVGDRTRVFQGLGARVVAVEPQPAVFRTLRLVTRGAPGVVLECAAVGQSAGTLDLRVNPENPTVSTLSEPFVQAADGAEGWEGQVWSETISVPVTTLDALITRHGAPNFIKIDVEGFEDKALEGLSQPVAALSFEVTTIYREAAARALDRLAALGAYQFALSLGEGFTLDSPWEGVDAMRKRIAELPHSANSGDVYARLSGDGQSLVPSVAAR